jgi:hypothetical protein
MPAARIDRSAPVSKRQFHDILLDWLANTTDKYIGSEKVDERTPWIHVQDDRTMFILHADTKRAAVLHYLKLVAIHGADITWTITLSQKGKMTAVAFGPSKERHTPFYLYVN